MPPFPLIIIRERVLYSISNIYNFELLFLCNRTNSAGINGTKKCKISKQIRFFHESSLKIKVLEIIPVYLSALEVDLFVFFVYLT